MRRRGARGKTRGAQIWHARLFRCGISGRRGMKRVLAIAGVLLAALTSAAAQPYPSRPITMIVPFGAGGPTDAVARIVAERMSAPPGEAVAVGNATGGSPRAPPAAHPVLLATCRCFVWPTAFYPNLPYDVTKDFEPVALLPNNPY